MPKTQGMRHKLERILSQWLSRIFCCLDMVKPTGVPKMAVRGFNMQLHIRNIFKCVFAQEHWIAGQCHQHMLIDWHKHQQYINLFWI